MLHIGNDREKQQAEALKEAGLTTYNHNLDTSMEYYPKIISTRSYGETLQTLKFFREAVGAEFYVKIVT